jgi:hypothetical protein
MRKRLLILAIGSLISTSIQNPAVAEWNGFSMLRDCQNTPDKPCIESITATTTDGKVIPAVLTGRVAIGDGTAPANIDDEYRLSGLTFEYPAQDKLIPRVFYDGSMFQTVFEAGWLDQNQQTMQSFIIPSPHRATNLNCGTLDNRQPCRRNINFNQDLTFNEKIRVPDSFITAYVNGRTDSLTYRTRLDPVLINGIWFSTIDLNIHITKKAQVAFSDLQPDPLSSSIWADSEIDQTIANFYSPQNVNAQRLGHCSGIPAISVISNGLNPDVPNWDPATQTMSVQVSGPHYKVNGEINAGFFQARISKAIAKCLWGIDVSGQTKAQLSLTDQTDNGATTIETIVGQFDGNDYVLTDSNFHYSSPTISVKLVNDQIPKSTSQSSNPVRNGIIQLTCVKGHFVKKVKGLNAKCPVGFKKA